MSAKDELREGLRKRGESWHKWPDEDSTTWQAYSNPHTATESMDGTLIVTGLTPAQAIAATLGAGTCELSGYADAAFRVVQAVDQQDFIDYAEVCECSACGASFIVPYEYERIAPDEDELWPKFNYCPNCGRKVVDE